MHTGRRAPVQFDRPPVLEVACGIAFSLPKPLKTAHIGLYWSKVAAEFPRCEDAAPLALIVEGPGAPASIEYSLQLEAVALPPMRRAWLINELGTHLLQLQEDRFVFNWKRTSEGNAYPSYRSVIADFRRHWAHYKKFLAQQELGEPVPRQLEMTYFNMLPGSKEYLRDHVRSNASDRFLNAPDALNWRSVFNMPESFGRLHVSAATGRNTVTGEPVIRLDLLARGLPKDPTQIGCEAWFDLAHDWITHGFADVTTPEAHKEWGRTA
jgi:uncharacterized protein (TIGR04255 family)